MDFNGNVHVEQRDRLEESRLNTLSGEAEKIQLLENVQGGDREIDQRRENDPLKNLSAQNFVENGQHRTANPRGENYVKMAEDLADCDENHVWERKIAGQHYDNYGNEDNAARSDHTVARDPYRNCKSGINISVVSRGQPKAENSEAEKPMYSVSFKCCYDNHNSNCENKRRKLTPSGGTKLKKVKVQDNRNENVLSVQQVTDDCADNHGNYRCTFENCCGNCESYIVEIPNSDCNTFKNWQNNDFETGNACLGDCCCPRKMKIYSSNLSVLPRSSCGACSDGRNYCSTPTEPKYDFVEDDCHHTVSKQCLQRVHFAKNDDRPKRNHSSCSFCARKCTPSKASLFVQVDDSATDMCGQTFQHAYSMESFKDYDYGATDDDELDSTRGTSKTRSAPMCKRRCMGRPSAVDRSFFDRLSRVNSRLIYCPRGLDKSSRDTLCNARSIVSFQEPSDDRSQKECNTSANKQTADCNQQCDTSERSLWDDIRKGKIWTQLQDTYKSFVKVASTGIDQIVKQSSKLKRSKKSAKDCFTCGTNTKECEKTVSCSDQCNQSETCNDCMHEATCWNDVMMHEPTDCDAHCCGNFYCENIANQPQCRKVVCQNDHEGNAEEEITSEENWRFHDRDNVRWNPCTATYEDSCEDPDGSKRHACRKRGGADHSSQRKKPPSKRSNQNAGEKSSNPSGARNQVARRQAQPLANTDQQTERNVVHLDVSVQANAVHTVEDTPNAPYVTESVAYRKRVKTVRQYDSYPNQPTDFPYTETDSPAMIRDTPVIQELDTTLHPLVPATRRQQAQLRKCSAAQGGQPKCGVSTATAYPRGMRQETVCKLTTASKRDSCVPKDRPTARPDLSNATSSKPGKGVQCVIVRELRLICGTAEQQQPSSRVERQCLCSTPTTADRKDAPPTGPDVSADAPPAEEPVERKDDDAAKEMPVTTEETEESAQPEPLAQPAIEGAIVTEEGPPVTEEVPETGEAAAVEEPATDQAAELAVATVAESKEADAVGQTPETEGVTEGEVVAADVVQEATVIDEITEDPVAGMEDDVVVEDVTDIAVVDAETSEPADGRPTVTDQDEEYPSVEPIVESDAPADMSVDVVPRSSLQPPVLDSSAGMDQLDQRSPIEISKVFNGKRTHVSVQMQTSNTILTKILSEFQIGNKKQQVLMSIKLQTNDVPANDGPANENEDEEGRPPMPDHLNSAQRARSRRHSNARSQYRSGRNKTSTGGSGYQEDVSSSFGTEDSPSPPRSRYNSCSGPCGKKKLR